MRKIKFRAWDKANKQIMDWEDLLPIFDVNLFENLKDWELMQYTGLKDKNGKEIYEGDILKVNLPESTSEEERFTDEVTYMTTTLSPAKIVLGVIRILPKGGTKLLVKKILIKKPKHKLDEKYTESFLLVGSYLKFTKNDAIIGNIYENPELLVNKSK